MSEKNEAPPVNPEIRLSGSDTSFEPESAEASGQEEISSHDSTPISGDQPEKTGSREQGPSPRRRKEKVELDLEGLEKQEEESTPPSGAAGSHQLAGETRTRPTRTTVILITAVMLAGSAFTLGYQYGRSRNGRIREPRIPVPSPAPQSRSEPRPVVDSLPSYSLEPFFIPLTTEGTKTDRFLKLKVCLSFKDDAPLEEVSRKILTIRSRITTALLAK
ncbi:MAG: hypothetical protein JRJ26_01765, partial [Deltaproteobacteria bacterium]|nr:hypothetical protein [Deltaproteobacteria bacterium]